MAAIWLVPLLLGSGFAIATGRGMKGESDQRGHHSGVHGCGTGVGSQWVWARGNRWMVPNAAMPRSPR
jgi:hypothetical protein